MQSSSFPEESPTARDHADTKTLIAFARIERIARVTKERILVSPDELSLIEAANELDEIVRIAGGLCR